MSFKDRLKQVFFAGQASAVGNKARRLHKGGDIAGFATKSRRKIASNHKCTRCNPTGSIMTVRLEILYDL